MIGSIVAALISFGATPAAAAPAFTVALIGDVPYSASQRTQLPRLVTRINNDPAVGLVLHAGDIKSGSSRCDNSLYADRAALFGTFADPFVLTPGDNDWTDCHTSGAGRYLPTERLGHLRQVLYPQAGRTLGQNPITVTSQPPIPSTAPTARTSSSSATGW